MKAFTLKQAVSGAIGLYVIGFTAVVGIGFTSGNQPAPPPEPVVAVNDTPPATPPPAEPAPAPAAAPAPQPPPTPPPAVTKRPGSATKTPPPPPPAAKPSPAPKPPPAPAPSPAPVPKCGSGGACTANQVDNHDSKTDCWVIYSGKVYNITPFVPNHPGGEVVYTDKTCGQDVTQFLNGSASYKTGGRKHKHSSSAYSTLASYYVADLK